MRKSHSILSLACAMVLAGCQEQAQTPPPPAADDAALIGKTIGEALKALSLQLEEPFVLQEPPSIARAVEGRAPGGDEIYLYVKRGSVPFNKTGEWTLEIFTPLKVVGIARKHDGHWETHGQVIGRFHPGSP